jgi:drug/metabolite transporter (DMT)-like permease
MSLTAIILLTVSAITHAGWNLLSKKQKPSAAFFLATTLVGVLLYSPFLVLYAHTLAQFPPSVWWLIGGTGCAMAVYFWALANAYQSGDISIAYPLARSSPIIIVIVVTLILGRADQVSLQCILGIGLVVGGCFLIPMRRFSDIRLRNYLNATCLFALVAALGTAGYSLADDEALRHLRQAFAGKLGIIPITLTYASLETLSAALWLVLIVLSRKSERASFRDVIVGKKRVAILTGISIPGTYALALISMAFVRNVSYVATYRQLSIPLGAALGITLLGESPHRPKIVGVGIMFVGLVMVGLG